MTNIINRTQLKQLLDDPNENPIVVETLPREKYEEFHLPGAINVPVDEKFEKNIQQAVQEKDRKVIVYCWDNECDASPEAAKKMESLGYQQVFDYAEGKKAWRDAGMPIEEHAPHTT